ncbi:MAG: PspC domain-containing protein [Anaerolineaceae bacterium]|nr:PspC domain-containing protein [Anaerolineaceae bacterium]
MKRLYRNKSDVMIAGVCSGLGEYLDVDPTAIRLIFVLLFFIGFGGLWIYLILWIIMPVDPGQENRVVEVKSVEKTPAQKKVSAPKQTTAKKPIVKKAPVKKPAAKKDSKPKTSAKTSPVEKKKKE